MAPAAAHHAGQAPPISVLFAAFLGYNPIEHLVGAGALESVGPQARAVLEGHGFFPHVISGAFSNGLDTAFSFSIVACLIAAGASLLRGGRHHHVDEPAAEESAGRSQPHPLPQKLDRRRASAGSSGTTGRSRPSR